MKYEMIPFGIEEASEIMKRKQLLFPVRLYNDDKDTEPLFYMPPVSDQDVM